VQAQLHRMYYADLKSRVRPTRTDPNPKLTRGTHFLGSLYPIDPLTRLYLAPFLRLASRVIIVVESTHQLFMQIIRFIIVIESAYM